MGPGIHNLSGWRPRRTSVAFPGSDSPASVESFSSISDREEWSVAYFTELGKVLTSPRCHIGPGAGEGWCGLPRHVGNMLCDCGRDQQIRLSCDQRPS